MSSSNSEQTLHFTSENTDSSDFSYTTCLVAVPKSFLKKEVAGYSKENGFGVVKAATFQRDDFHDFSGVSFDERSPLISREVAKPKPGARDEQQTFPKLVYLSATPTQLSDGISTPVLYSIEDSHHREQQEPISSDSATPVVVADKGPLNRKLWILCSVTLFLFLAISAGILFYFLWTCPVLPHDQNRNQQCSSANRMLSMCDFTCYPGFTLKGSSNTTCQISRRWSGPIPTCQCPACYEGPQCQYTIDWNKIASDVSTIMLFSPKAVHYGNHLISCESHLIGIFRFNCKCKDDADLLFHECSHFNSAHTACTHAIANLIDSASQAGVYPRPCNEDIMKSRAMLCPPKSHYV